MPSKAEPYRDAGSHLADYVKRVALRLDRHSLTRHAARVVEREQLTTEDLPLLRLRRAGLDVVALDVLIALATGVVRDKIGLDPNVDALVSSLVQSDEIALRAALSPDAPLVRLGLVELIGDATTPQGQYAISIDERVAAFVRGEEVLDRRLREVVTIHYTSPASPAAIAGLLETAGPIVIEGPARIGKTAVAIAAAKGALVVDLEVLVTDDDPSATLRRARREAVLTGMQLVVRSGGWDETWPARLRRELVAMIQAREAIVTVRDGEILCRHLRGPRRVKIAMPPPAAQHAIWTDALGEAIDVTGAVSRYPLPPGDIVIAAARAMADASGPLTAEDVIAAARAQLCHRLGEVADIVSTSLTWDDLILRDDVAARIRELISAMQFRDRVMDDWGFGKKLPYGRSLSALFSGPPGTGKTMVASLIGKELGLEVFRVDLSKVVSKYIGETEKALGRVFEEASRCNAVLLFDEADSLFAKRTEVKTSNDRFANLEVNFLLQRLEAHDGIVILTTNAARSIDPAFLRRLRYRVEFTEPDEHERAQLWRAMMPASAPLAPDVDYAQLGRRFRLTGGHIKNAAVRAAFIAMSEGLAVIDHQMLVRSATLEWTELGHLPEVTVKKPAAEPTKPSMIWEPTTRSAPAPALVAVNIAAEAQLAKILASDALPGETIEMTFRRKEHELASAFATLTVAESRTLHARLVAATEPFAHAFQRMSPERRKRLLDFLLDARRREATKSRNRLAS